MLSTVGNVGSVRSSNVVFRRRIGVGAFVTAAVLAASSTGAMAGAEFKLGEDSTLSLGFGLRTSYTSTENGAANGSSNSNAFSADNTRIFMGASLNKYIKSTINFDRVNGASGTSGLQMIDGIAQFEFTEGFNVWLGRQLVMADRANTYGPFFTSAWSFPTVASFGFGMNGGVAGRDDGINIWGNLLDSNKLKYYVGAFNGHNRVAGGSNAGNKLMYTGRVQYNFLDPEVGFWQNATYLGDKNILSVGGSYQSQANGVGVAAAPGNLKVSNLDVLFETKTAGGYVPTIEGAYYKYSLGAIDFNSGETGAPAAPALGTNFNNGGFVSGKSYLGTFAFLFPQKVGWGQVQPFVRYQRLDRDVTQTSNKATDFGVNYLIKGFNAKVSAVYTKLDDSRNAAATRKADQFLLGVQLIY